MNSAVASSSQRVRHAGALLTRVGSLVLFGGVAAGSPALPPPIHHVFVVVLENEEYRNTFGPSSPAHYLKALRKHGAAVPNYYATSHLSLGNYLALISGQAPNESTNLDCEVFEEFISSGTTPDGQAIGKGCVYPPGIPTLANQLDEAHLSWKGYMEDMGNNPRRESTSCAHPPLGAPDNTVAAEVGDQYATRHDPFVYFHAIIDTPSCAQHVVNLSTLAADLSSIDTTPNYSFITPNLCHDGHDGGNGGRCVDGAPGGLVSADQFLSELVPQILASTAYRRDGLLIITFDESDLDEALDQGTGGTVLAGDAAACCNEQPGPNIPPYKPGALGSYTRMNGPGLIGPGGGRVGAVLLSPYIRPGTVSAAAYNHYALLKSIEDIFRRQHLGYAAQPGLKGFGADIYTKPAGARK